MADTKKHDDFVEAGPVTEVPGSLFVEIDPEHCVSDYIGLQAEYWVPTAELRWNDGVLEQRQQGSQGGSRWEPVPSVE